MLNGAVGLIGLGVVGAPIAFKLYQRYGDSFLLVADRERRQRLQNTQMSVNSEPFAPRIISTRSELDVPLRLLIVCVKNYQLNSALVDIKNVINDQTIILALQNGIYAFGFFKKEFPNNNVLPGFVLGPNTKKSGNAFNYTNAGSMHIGDQSNSVLDVAADVYAYLSAAGIDVHLEQDIKRMVWRKWMLNVAGNSVTALTNADYSNFKNSPELQELCRDVMQEFVVVAEAEGIHLSEADIDSIILYYTTYGGTKRTSMLDDVTNNRKTENEYLAGQVLELASKHNIDTPIIRCLYSLLKVKEWLYLQ